MCNIRGYRHACNHTVFRYISTCRATYSDPNSPSTPRCIPSASYLINMMEECVQCKFENFCLSWRKRISEAEQRRDVFAAQLNPTPRRRDTWSDEGRYSNKWSSWNGWSSESDDHSFAHEIGSEYWGDSEDCNDTPEECLTSIEKAILIRERDEADDEARRLQHEFDREKWEHWQGLLTGADIDTLSKRSAYWSQKRRTSPKINGGSSLKYVENSADLPDPEEPPADIFLFGAIEQSGDESDSSDCSITPTLSHCSTVSDDFSSPELGAEFQLDDMNDEKLSKKCHKMVLTLDMEDEKSNAYSRFEDVGSMEDAEGEMLPMWLECY